MKPRYLYTAVLLLILSLLLPTGITARSVEATSAPTQTSFIYEPIEVLDQEIEEAIADAVMPGAVLLIVKDGKKEKFTAYGDAVRYKDDQYTEMEQPQVMKEHMIFDMASISKLYTAVAVMQLWDEGLFELEDPVYRYIPEFAIHDKRSVTIRQLLTHTSGFAASPSKRLYEIDGNRADRLDFVLREPLQRLPDTEYIYSDVNYITLGILIERLSGDRQDQFVAKHITEPMGLKNTMYNPPASLKHRIAATEYQPWTNRGLVWGSVHDENAWALDGVAGQAGIFTNAEDLAVFAQMILNNGTHKEKRILSEEAVNLMNTNWNKAYPGQDHGLGWELNQDWYMDNLAETDTMGHTGYTGTSIVVSPTKHTIVILLTNRVHPTRNTVSTNPIRKLVSERTADAIYSSSAEKIKELVERFVNREELNMTVANPIQRHLTVIHHYEDKYKREKVLKHLNGYDQLIKILEENGKMSKNIYDDLQRTANYLFEKWQ